MKKSLFDFFILMAIIVMPLVSCEKEKEDKFQEEERMHDPYSDEDLIPVTDYNSLSWFQGSLVVLDENGEVFRRIYGKPLDESQPDVISVAVKDYPAAEKLFLGWVAPGKEVVKVDGGYDYNFTDEEGNAQGGVSFRAVEGEAGVKARITVAEGTDLKHIGEVNFVGSEFWPENDAPEKYEAGKTYKIEDYFLSWRQDQNTLRFFQPDKELLEFYCIQSNTEDQEGILIWLSPDGNDDRLHPKCIYYLQDIVSKYLPSEESAKKVVDFYNSNKDFWINMLKEMDAKGYDWSPQDLPHTTNNSEFMINKRSDLSILWKLYCMDLDLDETGEIDWALNTSTFHYRYMHIKIIPALID